MACHAAQAERQALAMAVLNAVTALLLVVSLPHAAACSADMEMGAPLLPTLTQIEANAMSIFEVITKHHHAPLVLTLANGIFLYGLLL